MKNKYKFSIIMSIYNVEQWIEEAVESIVNQTIGFKENVQIIFINDGSLDNSEKICLKYRNLYPDNIKYIKNKEKNRSLAFSKNEGLKHAEGKYINFFDSKDILSPNSLSEVYNFFERNSLVVDIVFIPMYLFEEEICLHSKYKYMENKNRIINLIEEPHNFVLSSISIFYKMDIIKNMKFNESLICLEDTKFNLELFSKNNYIGYVCKNETIYYCRRVLTNNSITDYQHENINFYEEIKRVYNDKEFKSYEKEMIIYDLIVRYNSINKKVFKTEKSLNSILTEYEKILKNISVNDIVFSKRATSLDQKIILLKEKNIHLEELFTSGNLISNINVMVKNYEIKNKKLIIEVIFNNYNCNNFDIVAFDGKNNLYEAKTKKDIEGPYDIDYGKFKLDITHYRKFEFNINRNKIIKFIIFDKKNNRFIPINKLNIDPKTRLVLKDEELGLRYHKKIVKLIGRKFKITNCSLSTFKYNWHTFIHLYKKYKKNTILRLFNRRKKKYILINDRPEKAGDNGEALFKYINKYRKDLASKTYFVISKKSKDYKRLKKIGKVVDIKSIKHKVLFINSKYIYSSHNHLLFFYAFDLTEKKYYSDLFNFKFIWLQHGITINGVCKATNRLHSKDDSIIVATQGEYNEFSSEKYFYEEKDILLTGFSRFDYLENKSKNIITLCPTWRRSLTGRVLEDGTHETLPNFENSDYYKNYSKILTDKRILKLLNENNYELHFILHPGMDNYKEHFDKFASDKIKIIKQKNVIYSEVFANSKLLITDYSSVFFDFAYLKKPEIFFQFDKEEFFSKHYQNGYFSYEKDAFGDVLYDLESVIHKIEYYFQNDFKMEDKYIKKVESTYKYTDKNNCERIINNTYKD